MENNMVLNNFDEINIVVCEKCGKILNLKVAYKHYSAYLCTSHFEKTWVEELSGYVDEEDEDTIFEKVLLDKHGQVHKIYKGE